MSVWVQPITFERFEALRQRLGLTQTRFLDQLIASVQDPEASLPLTATINTLAALQQQALRLQDDHIALINSIHSLQPQMRAIIRAEIQRVVTQIQKS